MVEIPVLVKEEQKEKTTFNCYSYKANKADDIENSKADIRK